MAVELGAAYISLLPSTSKFVPEFNKTISSAQGAAASGGKNLGGLMFGAVAGVGMSLMNKAISTISNSMGAAISRVDTLNAFPKVMANLGYSADDAQASITKMSDKLAGLPTSLDTMAGAVQVMAPLTSSLAEATDISLALNNALIAGGKSTQEQANALEQFVQMLAVGKVDMQAWRSMVSAMPGQMDQLAKSLLGAEAKQTDLYEAMQNGTVTFDDFNQELLKLNDTGLSGFASFQQQALDATGGIGTMFTNMKTAVTRNLANVIDALSPVITSVLTGITSFINTAGPMFAGFADGVASWLGGVDFSGFIDGLSSLLGPAMEVWQALSPMSIAMEVLVPLLPMIGGLFSQVGGMIQQVLPPILELGALLVATLVPVISQLVATVIPPLIQIFGAVVPVIGQLVTALMPVITTIAGLLMPVIQALMPVVQTVFGVIADVVTAVMTVVSGVIQTVTAIIAGDWKGAWEGIKTVFSGVWAAIKAILVGAWNIIKSVFTAALNIIGVLWNAAWSAISSFFSNIWNSIVSAATGFFNSVKAKFTAVTDFVQGIPGKILGFFANIGSTLINSGRSLIQGFLDGIMAGFNKAKDFVSDGLGKIRDLFPFSPAKDGPFSGRGWVAYSGMSIGETFTDSIVQGISDGRSDVSRALAGVQGEFGGVARGGVALSASGQWDAMSRLAEGGGMPRSVKLVVRDREFDAFLEEVADDRVEANFTGIGRGSMRRDGGF